VAKTSLLLKLHPAKIRAALHRRWFERQIKRTPVSGRGEPTFLGSKYGGWIIPSAIVEPGWTCYCVGAGGDVSFDLELIRRFDVRVRCVEPVEEYVTQALHAANGNTRFSAYRAAIARSDGPVRMEHTRHPGSRSLSSTNLYDSHEYIQAPGRTLPSLMRELGDERMDLLKLDIEGGEYDVLPALDLRALEVKVLAIQIHHNRSVAQAQRLIEHLLTTGYELLAIESVLKLTFAQQNLL
jgi:FkbM family methyltransferase